MHASEEVKQWQMRNGIHVCFIHPQLITKSTEVEGNTRTFLPLKPTFASASIVGLCLVPVVGKRVY